MAHFDEAAFKRRWRVLCQAYGVDSVRGATTYQAALARANWLRRPPGHWWRNPDFWEEWEGYDGGCERSVEEEALESLWQQTRRRDTKTTLLEVAEEWSDGILAELAREVWRELEGQGVISFQPIHRQRHDRHRRRGRRRKAHGRRGLDSR